MAPRRLALQCAEASNVRGFCYEFRVKLTKRNISLRKQEPGMAMTEATGGPDEAKWLRWRRVADLYHAYFTGLILTVVTRRGTADAAELVFRVFRRQQQEHFLPGLEKLGLSHLPPAVAAAQYHYLSNWIGGVSVEYMYETDRKAWIRYPPPRWIWRGTAICCVPGEVSRAMLRGWHANNGVSLDNPTSALSAPSRASTGRTALKAITANMTTRSSPMRGWYSPAISRHRCSTPQRRRRCRLRAGRNRGWKKPTEITRCNICAPPRRPSAASDRQAHRHAVFR
jgi:hypothetical protein